MTIRHSTFAELPVIMRLLDYGRNTMRQNGNNCQWIDGYPSERQVLLDIESGNSFFVCDQDKPIATFAMIIGKEPTYKNIYEGDWTDDTLPYATIHRLASLPGTHGSAALCFDYAFRQTRNVRIDTHRDNTIMRHLAEKHGFSYCGIIYLANGDERLAFQKIG